jgi:hypothetical protein
MRRSFCLLLGLGLLAAAVGFGWSHFGPPTVPPPEAGATGPGWFADVTDAVGIDFVHVTGPVEKYFMPEMMGSGAAILDFDRDGRMDLYLLQMGGPKSPATNRLYRQRPDGTFEDVSKGSGLDIRGHNTCVAVGDVNNDGWPDVVVGQYGGIRLFLNNGDGTFRDATTQAGLSNPGWASALALFDYNRDGWLDLVVVNYLDYDPSWPCYVGTGRQDYCRPQVFPGAVTRLFRNRGQQRDGESVRFEEVTVGAGLARYPAPGLGVVCADFNGDGWPDICIANDGKPNHLWINQKDGTFQEEAVIRGVAYNGMGQAHAGMGIVYGDVDGDGLMDLFVTHLSSEAHTLWKQGPRGLFRDQTQALGLNRPRWQGTGFGTALADFDQDGALDLAVVNGHVTRASKLAGALGTHWGWYADRNQLFHNDSKGRFKDISEKNRDFCGALNVGRGLAWGDLDGDGSIDLVVTTAGGRARIYRNVVPGRGNWLMIQALLPSPLAPADPRRDRDAYGAEVTVHAGKRRWARLINPADGYLCSNDPRAHFGLGAVDRVDRIEIRWPDGSKETFPGGSVNKVRKLRKGGGRK